MVTVDNVEKMMAQLAAQASVISEMRNEMKRLKANADASREELLVVKEELLQQRKEMEAQRTELDHIKHGINTGGAARSGDHNPPAASTAFRPRISAAGSPPAGSMVHRESAQSAPCSPVLGALGQDVAEPAFPGSRGPVEPRAEPLPSGVVTGDASERNWVAEMQAAIDKEQELSRQRAPANEEVLSGDVSAGGEKSTEEREEENYWALYEQESNEEEEEGAEGAKSGDNDEPVVATAAEPRGEGAPQPTPAEEEAVSPKSMIVGGGVAVAADPDEGSSDDADYWDDMAGTDYDG